MVRAHDDRAAKRPIGRALRMAVLGALLACGADPAVVESSPDTPPPVVDDAEPAEPEPAVRVRQPEPEPSSESAKPRLSPPFRIATYNVNFATRDLSTVVRLIDRTEADVVVLQETTARSSKALAKRTKAAYPYAHFEPRSWAGGHAILSRTPLRDVAMWEPKHGSFGALAAVVEVADRELQLVSVHLEPTLPRRGASHAEVAATFVHNEAIREQQLQDIFAALDPTLPHVLAGDFNSPPTLAVSRRLSAAGYVDSQAQDAERADAPTWHWNWRGAPLTLRIDYIQHGPELETLDSEVFAEGPSDHYPLVSTLAWRN